MWVGMCRQYTGAGCKKVHRPADANVPKYGEVFNVVSLARVLPAMSIAVVLTVITVAPSTKLPVDVAVYACVLEPVLLVPTAATVRAVPALSTTVRSVAVNSTICSLNVSVNMHTFAVPGLSNRAAAKLPRRS